MNILRTCETVTCLILWLLFPDDIHADVRDAPSARLHSELLSKREFMIHSISERFLFRGSEREVTADRYTRPNSGRYVLYLLWVLMHSFILHPYACSVAYHQCRVWPIAFYRKVAKGGYKEYWENIKIYIYKERGEVRNKEILLAYITPIEF